MNHQLHSHGDGPEHIDCICKREITGMRLYKHCECGRFWQRFTRPTTISPEVTDANEYRTHPYKEGR